MNGKDVLNGFDLDDHCLLDKEVDAVTKLNRNSLVNYRKGLFDFKVDGEFLQFVSHANPIGSLQQSWPQFGMNPIRCTQDAVCQSGVNKMMSVSSVRVRALRGSAFETQMADRF
jgi:hypothetical protein